MLIAQKSWIDDLVNFSRLISEAAAPLEVFPLLAEFAVRDLDADAAAVYRVTETAELELIASKNLDASPHYSRVDATIGSELSGTLLRFCGGKFQQAHAFPLVSETDLFGALVVFYKEPSALDEPRRALAEAFVQLAAIAASKANQHLKLRRAYTDLQASQELLARTEKLRALGQMSASISHDLKNLLAPLGLQAQLLRRVAGDHEAVLKLADSLERCVRRGVDTTERMREFSRQSPEEADAAFEETAAVDDLIREVVELSKPKLLDGGVRLELELSNPPPIRVKASEFVTAFMNLVFNASDAMAGGGTLTISSGISNGYVWVKVTDTGTGMSDEVKKRIFEPFFTTKGKAGTGLGLPMVYSFVQRHGGEITLDSAPGQGTTFTLSFPQVTPQDRPSPENAKKSETRSSHNGHQYAG